MAKFISITSNISELTDGNRFVTVAVYAYLKDFITSGKLEVYRYNKAIAEDLGISTATVKRAVVSLKQMGLVLDIIKKDKDANGKELLHKCNIYRFNNDMLGSYFMINPAIINSDLDAKTKGFLLILRSFCKNGSNVLPFGSLNKLKDMLKIGDIRTLNSFLEKVASTPYIKMIGNNIIFNREYFYIYNPSQIHEDEKKLYEYIWDYCYINDVVPPIKHNNGREVDKTLSLMATQLRGEQVDIKKRVPKLPETVTLEYFLKALCNDQRSRINNNFEFVL